MKYKDILKNNPFTVAIILFAALISGITFYFSAKIAVFELIIIILLAVFSLRWISRSVERKKSYLRCMESSLRESDEIGDYTLCFPFPFMLVDSTGHIEWFNSDFIKILDEINIQHANNIADLIPDSGRFLYRKNFDKFSLRTKKSDYTVYPAQINENLFSIYFVEDTELKNINRKYLRSRPCVLLINVDSLEQTEDSLAHADYYSVLADIEREISKWLVSNNCIFRKFAEGKFFAVTEKEYFDKMCKNKFDILDTVRFYRFGDQEMEITLSAGAAAEDNFALSEASARQALDMARGRGGDQVAVKSDDGYSFFGGITGKKEKRGKIKSRYMASMLYDHINKYNKILVMGHNFSDFDAIGAAVGIAAIAKAAEKEVHIIVNRKNSLAMPLVNLLDNDDDISFISPEQAFLTADEETLLIITDTMRMNLLDAPKVFDKVAEKIIIDHHRMTVDHITDCELLFHEPYASSACEMVTELIQYSPVAPRLTHHEAEALLSGIILDTKNFTLRVGTRTFEAAAYLRDNKADTVTVRKLFSGSVEENISVSRLITTAEFTDNYAVVCADEKTSVSRLIAAKTADELLNIDGVDASFVITQSNGNVSISARSLGKINVQLIMEQFGGGGHQSMAACQLPECDIKSANKMLKDAIKNYLSKNS